MTLPIILCSAQSSEDMGDLLWVQTSLLVYRKQQHSWSNIVQSSARSPAVKTDVVILILWYCYSYQSTALWVHQMLCSSTTASANSVFECNISEATLVSKKKNKGKSQLHYDRKSNYYSYRGDLKAISQINVGNKSSEIWFSASLRAEKQPRLFGFYWVLVKICKSAHIMYDLEGKRGPEHDPLPSAATT